VDIHVIKVGNRLGDNADMAMIELVDFNEYTGGEVKKSKADVVEKLRKQMRLLKLQLLKGYYYRRC
jgi:hypothetical protein